MTHEQPHFWLLARYRICKGGCGDISYLVISLFLRGKRRTLIQELWVRGSPVGSHHPYFWFSVKGTEYSWFGAGIKETTFSSPVQTFTFTFTIHCPQTRMYKYQQPKPFLERKKAFFKLTPGCFDASHLLLVFGLTAPTYVCTEGNWLIVDAAGVRAHQPGRPDWGEFWQFIPPRVFC